MTDGIVAPMTRDEAIRVGIFTLAEWHRRDHGQRCVCEQLGAQSAAVVDALVAEGMSFDRYSGTGPRAVGPPL
jgi:sugar (pentulose or hexulose) kinase